MAFSTSEERDKMTGQGLNAVRNLYNQWSDEERGKYALVEVNLKNFQYYNAKYGKEFGDFILELVYQVIERLVEGRGFVNHTYADTFHFFIEYEELPGKTDDDCLLDSFLMDLLQTVFLYDHPTLYKNIFLSVGVILPRFLHGDFEQLIFKLGVTRKSCPHIHSRVNSYEIYTDEKYAGYIRKLDLAKRLTFARVNNEFQLYVQPKVDIRTNKIVGGEVLMRWSQSGDVPLREYLALLVEFAEIYVVDKMLFRTACKYLKEGLDQNRPRVPLSFNITNLALLLRNSHQEYVSIMEEIGVPSQYIEMEVLEDVTFQDNERIPEILRYFKEKHVRCSLDDFGTGNSSFAFLLNGDIDAIKLDRIFFRGELTPKRKALLRQLFEIGRNVGVDVIAEGVEDQVYIDYLREIGGTVVQGFYYYKPMPLEEFQALLDQQEEQKQPHT